MAAIKITGFDPDQFERPDPEPSSRTIRRRSSDDETPSKPVAPPREVRKPVDKDTAEHLRIKYGLTNVKYSELAPKKSGSRSSMKSGASNRYGGPRLSLEPEKVAGAAARPAGAAASAPEEPAAAPEPASAGAESSGLDDE